MLFCRSYRERKKFHDMVHISKTTTPIDTKINRHEPSLKQTFRTKKKIKFVNFCDIQTSHSRHTENHFSLCFEQSEIDI
jgi:hypothetical protein